MTECPNSKTTPPEFSEFDSSNWFFCFFFFFFSPSATTPEPAGRNSKEAGVVSLMFDWLIS